MTMPINYLNGKNRQILNELEGLIILKDKLCFFKTIIIHSFILVSYFKVST